MRDNLVLLLSLISTITCFACILEVEVVVIFYRVKQFYLSLTAKVLEKDERFVASYLNIKEQDLFFKLQVFEQRHCINVAYDVNNHVDSEHKNYLIRLALLHDIGKIEMQLTPVDKAVLVVLDKLTKGKMRKHTKCKKVNVYYNHGEIGYTLLEVMGGYDQEFLERVRDHHSKEDLGDELLGILQKWDDKN